MNKKTFYDIEMECQSVFDRFGPFHHLCTPGYLTENIFADREIKEIGLNFLGICCKDFDDFRIVAFSEMTNHLHLLYGGSIETGNEYFESYLSKLRRVIGKTIYFTGFTPKILPVPDLKAVRNEIVYINRNGYVVNPHNTPFSYPWGSGLLYFNPLFDKIPSKPFYNLTRDQKRMICRSRDLDLPLGYSVVGNIILPSCYCRVHDIGEKLFRDAHQYFNLLSRDYEAYSEVAKRLGDKVYISDEEMFSVVSQICRKYHGVTSPALLTPNDRIEVAKRMHRDYNASNKQINRILKLDRTVVDQLFPIAD